MAGGDGDAVELDAVVGVRALSGLAPQQVLAVGIDNPWLQIGLEHDGHEASTPMVRRQKHELLVLGCLGSRKFRSLQLDYVCALVGLVVDSPASVGFRKDCHNAMKTVMMN